MVTIICIIILNFILYKTLKNYKNKIEKDNKKYLNEKNMDKMRFYNVKIRMIIFNVITISSFLILSFYINKILIDNFEHNLSIGLLNYQILDEKRIVPDEDNVYAYIIETEDDDYVKFRAYSYDLSDGTKIRKQLSNGIAMSFGENCKEYTVNLRYDKFLRWFFIQYYSYQYKFVECKESLCDIVYLN